MEIHPDRMRLQSQMSEAQAREFDELPDAQPDPLAYLIALEEETGESAFTLLRQQQSTH